MHRITSNIRRIICKFILLLCRIFPLDDNKVVFSSYFSTKINDNPKAIFDAMKEIHPEGCYIWLLRGENAYIQGGEVVNAESIIALYHLATAKYWIDNSRKRVWVTKRKKQKYIQTWHGGIAMKRVEADVCDQLPELYVRAAQNDSRMADLFLSGSRWQTESIYKSYWYKGKVLEYGLPRSDIFFREDLILKAKNNVNEYYGIDSEAKIVLYAPTFRADGNTECYNIDYKSMIRSFKEKYGGNWVLLLRLHPIIAKKSYNVSINGLIIASDYQDMNELIIRSDFLITDYSSCMFDAMEAGKKVLLYASDIDLYANDRGFEFSFDELPFPIARNNEELKHVIESFDEAQYFDQREKFLSRVELYDNADSSYKVAEYIFNEL